MGTWNEEDFRRDFALLESSTKSFIRGLLLEEEENEPPPPETMDGTLDARIYAHLQVMPDTLENRKIACYVSDLLSVGLIGEGDITNFVEMGGDLESYGVEDAWQKMKDQEIVGFVIDANVFEFGRDIDVNLQSEVTKRRALFSDLTPRGWVTLLGDCTGY